MKNKRAFQLFLLDQLSLVMVVLVTQVIFFGALFYLKGLWLEEIVYFAFLVFFVLLVYLLVQFYLKGRVYGKILLQSESLNDYLIEEPRSAFEENYNAMIDQLLQNKGKAEIRQKQEKKLQKVMIYRFVHQIKTPLSVLKLICEKETNEENHQQIERNLQSIQYNLDQMIAAYRLDEFKNDFVSDKVYLARVCKDSVNALKDHFITSQVYPKIDIDEALYVYSDSKWLKLVIQQLLTNAIKYSYKGQTVRLAAKQQDEHVTLSVIDDGIGIEQVDLQSIFDLFYVGKNGRNNADSSGIGLYIVRRVLDYLGHDLEVASEVGKGTRMTIIF